MAIFRYEAADGKGKILRGAMDAATAQEVTRRLTEKGYRQVQVQGGGAAAGKPQQSITAAAPVRGGGGGLSLGAAVRPEDLGLFFRQLGALVQSGFSINAALSDLAMRTTNRQLRAGVAAMAAATATGGSLAGEMARHPHLFAPHVVGLVHAGETGGFLPFAFEEAALSAEQDAALRQGLWLARFLIWQSVWSVLLFQPLFPNINPDNMPQSFVNYGRSLLLISIPLGLLLHALALLGGWAWRQPFAVGARDRLALRIPVMARLAKKRALAAFTRVLRRLLMAGISPEPAFVGAARSVPNTILSERLMAGVSLIRAGQGLDAAVQATGLMDNDPLQMLVTGQKTGQWLEMLDRVTGYYQEEAAVAIEAAKTAQKRVGVLLTIITTGYVMIVGTHGMATIGFKWTEGWTE